MPIKHSPSGGVTITGDSIDYLQLCAQRGAVSLEMKGIRMTRGRKVWPALAAKYQIRPRTAAAVLAFLEQRIDELRPQQEHITPEGKRMVDGQEVQ